MRATVVYESMFGCTRDVALAVAEGLATVGAVDVDEVGDAARELPIGTQLLVLGAPTHSRGLSRQRTRAEAVRRAPRVALPDTERIGAREWVDLLRGQVTGVRAATFDTRVESRLAGSAATRASRLLERRGFVLVDEPRGFVVEGLTGPVRPGELDRAREWGAALGRQVAEALASH